MNTPNDLFKTPEQFWLEYNQRWLDEAIARGDIIKMVTEPTLDNLYVFNHDTNLYEITEFGREYEHLLKHGYEYDSLTKSMIKKGVAKMKNVWTEVNDAIPKYLSEVAQMYSLKFVKISSIETALVSKHFALTIFIDKFYIMDAYITRDDSGELIVYCSGNYFAEKFDDADRKEIILSEVLKEKLLNQLIVTNRGLINKWSDVLRGEKGWIQSFKKSEWYSTRRPNEYELRVLNHLIE